MVTRTMNLNRVSVRFSMAAALFLSIHATMGLELGRRSLLVPANGGKQATGLLQHLMDSMSLPPGLPENPIPFSASVFDPMTQAWYTTEYDPLAESDIDEDPGDEPESPTFKDFEKGDLAGVANNITTAAALLKHHMPTIAKVVDSLFHSHNLGPMSLTPLKMHQQVKEKAHGFLITPSDPEPAPTTTIRRGRGADVKPLHLDAEIESPVATAARPLDPPVVNERPAEKPQPALERPLEQPTPSPVHERAARERMSGTTKAAVVIGIIAAISACAALAHWYFTKSRGEVAYHDVLDDNDLTELGSYEAVDNIGDFGGAHPKGDFRPRDKNSLTMLNMETGDSSDILAFRP